MSPFSHDSFALQIHLMAEVLRPIFEELCSLAGTEPSWMPGQPDRPSLIGVRMRAAAKGPQAVLRTTQRAARTAHQEVALARLAQDMQDPLQTFVRLVQKGIPALAHPGMLPSFLSMDAGDPGAGNMLFGPLVVRVPKAHGYKRSIEDVASWLVALHARVGHLPAPAPDGPIWIVGAKEIPAPTAAQAVFVHQSAQNPFQAWPPKGKRSPRLPRVSRLEDPKPLIAAALELVPQ